MGIKLTMALVSEGQEGNLGDDWKYELETKIFCERMLGDATVSVPKHNLKPGTVIEPFGSPEPIVLFEGECSDELLLRLMLTATEVDVLFNDVGKASKDIRLELPAPGRESRVQEVEIAAGVRESPGIRVRDAVFTLRLRFTIENTP